VSLVNENVTPYCYVKMSSPALEASGGGGDAGWIGSTDDQARAGAVGWVGVRAVGRLPISGGTPVRGRGAIVDPEPMVRARPSWGRPYGGDRRSAPGEARG